MAALTPIETRAVEGLRLLSLIVSCSELERMLSGVWTDVVRSWNVSFSESRCVSRCSFRISLYMNIENEAATNLKKKNTYYLNVFD